VARRGRNVRHEQPIASILKYRRERSAAAVRERVGPALTIVRDETPDGHGLHGMVGDADRAVDNGGRDAEQITRSCALSFVVSFSMAYSRRQLLANAAMAASRVVS
jgi:hypothetical protein